MGVGQHPVLDSQQAGDVCQQPEAHGGQIAYQHLGLKGKGQGVPKRGALLHDVDALGYDAGQHHDAQGEDDDQGDGVAGAVSTPQIAVAVKGGDADERAQIPGGDVQQAAD